MDCARPSLTAGWKPLSQNSGKGGPVHAKIRGIFRLTVTDRRFNGGTTQPFNSAKLETTVLISDAYAAPTPGAQEQIFGFLPLIVIFVLFYFMLIRPQMKRAKEQKKMIDALQKGDEVITAGGLLGKITKVGEQFVSLEIADNVTIQVQKQTVQTLLPKGSVKSAA